MGVKTTFEQTLLLGRPMRDSLITGAAFYLVDTVTIKQKRNPRGKSIEFHAHSDRLDCYGQFSKVQPGKMCPDPGKFELSKGILKWK